jgi:hypothetical protein
LNRPIDVLAARGLGALLAVFLVGAALLAVAGGSWSERAAVTEQRAQHGWHQVTAQVTAQVTGQPPARREFSGDLLGGFWVRARWVDPAGHQRSHLISVESWTPAGKTMRIWVNAAGRWSGPPLSNGTAQVRVLAVTLLLPVALAAFLLGIGLIGRRVVNQRRLTSWDEAWVLVGPQWTREFWAQS